jgi:hypothetical protein
MPLHPDDPRGKLHYVVGISLGIGNDPTGFCVLAQHVRTEGWYVTLDRGDVGHLTSGSAMFSGSRLRAVS